MAWLGTPTALASSAAGLSRAMLEENVERNVVIIFIYFDIEDFQQQIYG